MYYIGSKRILQFVNVFEMLQVYLKCSKCIWNALSVFWLVSNVFEMLQMYLKGSKCSWTALNVVFDWFQMHLKCSKCILTGAKCMWNAPNIFWLVQMHLNGFKCIWKVPNVEKTEKIRPLVTYFWWLIGRCYQELCQKLEGTKLFW